ncbi:MAG: hypothetical protein JST22_17840 [Bacteroidetes bacterium]|nr:hypothetical protein [Bacteroidota bacterium]
MSNHSKTEPDSSAGRPADDTDETPLRCGACLAFGYRDDKYCACCGAPLRRLCRQCGAAVLQPVAFFCTQCGARLGGDDADPRGGLHREKISSGDERGRAQRDRHTTT